MLNCHAFITLCDMPLIGAWKILITKDHHYAHVDIIYLFSYLFLLSHSSHVV